MHQIKQYLQYKNTPDGKPRVLVEGVDYNTIYNNDLYLSNGETIGKYVSAIEYCRPILTVEIDGKEYSEGDVIYSKDKNKNQSNPSIIHYEEEYGVFVENCTVRIPKEYKNQGSFFDNPAKYSKLLWDCSEEEGIDKVLKILNVK